MPSMIHFSYRPSLFMAIDSYIPTICNTLLLQIICCGIVNKLSGFREPGAVAAAIPGMLRSIPFQGAAHMRAPGFCRRQKIYRRLKAIDQQLGPQHGSGG